MTVAIVPVPEADKPILWARMQDYIAELMVYMPGAPQAGPFDYPYFDLYWTEPDRFAYWAMVEGERVAFALVRRAERIEMAEFYSFPEQRRSGQALEFARAILKRFPGPWTLSEFQDNTGAVAFWRKAIVDYPYTERTYTGGSGALRLEQVFDVPG